MHNWTKKQKKTIFSAFLLILASAAIGAVVLYKVTADNLERQMAAYGSALSSQLAVTLTDNMISRDILSLNVLLSEFVQQQYFDYATAYNADHRLVAQAGERKIKIDYRTFTADISFQDEIEGYVEIGVNPEANYQSVTQGLGYLLFYNLLLALAFLILYLHPDWFWKYLPREILARYKLIGKRDGGLASDQSIGKGVLEQGKMEQVDTKVIMLVVKTASSSRSENHLVWMSKGLALYGGEIQSQQPGEYCLVFSGLDSIRNTLCCALLIRAMCMQMSPQMEFRAGIHLADQEDSEICRKHASYLASISKTSILLSREIKEILSDNADIKVDEYRDSAASKDQVYVLNNLAQETNHLIERQARQLASQECSN